MHTFWSHASISSVNVPVDRTAYVVACTVYSPGWRESAIRELSPWPPSSSKANIAPSAPAPRIKYRWGFTPGEGEERSTVTIISCVRVKL